MPGAAPAAQFIETHPPTALRRDVAALLLLTQLGEGEAPAVTRRILQGGAAPAIGASTAMERARRRFVERRAEAVDVTWRFS